ncbi:glycoside hydrolase family 2 TIM barrel-domain containing protein [Paraglaciecola sp. L3A3]|uniref:glycoside hydrolase family 2 TIM barrel-domain containing protein n=1 Tax=Paraglaciecola sp. L3A3 TaxID=2686358 RepID=UPI00131E2D68|nr:glycoside hydrolase family 2 TIM barrel-domain containing protein [Paraglaciecola sp. L3A3]
MNIFRPHRSTSLSAILLCWLFTLIAFNATAVSQYKAAQFGEKQSFNNDWLFSKGKHIGAEQAKFDDSNWQHVTLPHDWAIEGPFDSKYNARNGGLPFHGDGWYRKSFKVSEADKGKFVSVTFDGAMYDAHVYINGHFLGRRPFGYTAVNYDLTPHLFFGTKENVIAVSLSPKDLSTRWYPGAGLYRHTWLEINDPVHVAKWGTYVTTPEVTRDRATVALETQINNFAQSTNATLQTEIVKADGTVVLKESKKLGDLAKGTKTVNQTFTLKNPILWDTENPYRYKILSSIVRNGKIVDQHTTPLGVRHLEFKPDDGFWLNWRRVQINGVCLHHDNGPIGAIANRRAIQRKLEIMQSMGVNSVRTSHNPPSPEMVELADEMGILLQVESFDVWAMQKQSVHNGYQVFFDEWHERDLTDMIIQYRNNPSVYMWSIGNEIMEQGHKNGGEVAAMLTKIAHKADPSRLVSAGFNNPTGAIKNGLADAVDIVGLNYKPLSYEQRHKDHPTWPLVASETSSITSTRGVYHFPIDKYKTHDSRHVTSYDIIGPPWAYPPEIEFEYLAKTPAVMGEYMWTGFDYLGEPTPYGGKDHSGDGYWNADWPVRSSSFGAVDLVGFPKDRYYLYQSQWTTKPMVHVLPHWNWENKIGEEIPVFAYTNAEEVELFVNGKSMGRKVKGVDKAELPVNFLRWDKENRDNYQSAYRLRWDVKYQPGEIKVVAYTKAQVVAEETVKTAGLPASVELIADRKVIDADGQDLSYVTVLVKDKDGNICPTADNHIRFFVEGAGEIAAVGNGNSATVAPFKADYRRAFNGKAMLIVKSKNGQSGNIRIRAYSEQLSNDPIVITAK